MNVRSAIAKATALLVYLLKKEQEEESVFQSASGKLEDVFATSIESVDIKSVICGRINKLQRKAVWRGTRSFRQRTSDVIHSVLWLVKGRAIAAYKDPILCPHSEGGVGSYQCRYLDRHREGGR